VASLLLALAVAVLVSAVSARPAEPGVNPLFATSPDGRYVAGCLIAGADDAGEYDFFVRDRRTGTDRVLDRFSRAADVQWSPDSRHLAVTFWNSSSHATLVVYSMNRAGRPLRLGHELAADLDQVPEVVKNDHVYFQAVSWRGVAVLRVRVFGHGDRDPKGFAKCFGVACPPHLNERGNLAR
jgi:hypothetical protein